ncbi:SDR family NAD(P)-dependent oxidoreductase [Cohnella fermenti]|uniref:SDR family oxidoreductase n=1 Tax=Cohnella fermenti TaxID=2565925 RepID=A0A4S4CB13_9BACL|nr:SDR family NAD(P)-dependent oxidoreductase [Cohnella fermenti]THF84633.1 SDR family oxidoreductase [Cohnella fermenti]
MEFANKVVLVTGSGNGIGRSIASSFAREGAVVVIADIDRHAAEATCEEIIRAGGKARWHESDVSASEQVVRLFDKVIGEFGVLDVLVNNVGSTIRKPIVEFSEAEWDFVFDTNVKSMFLCAKEAGRLMLKRRTGAVVNISSVHGLGGISRRLPYSTSKSAVESFTKTLACEWALDGVRVNCVAPGYILTEGMRGAFASGALNQDDMIRRTPQARLGTPEDIAEAVLYLSSKRAAFVTGAILHVDGGYAAYHGPEPVPSFNHVFEDGPAVSHQA